MKIKKGEVGYIQSHKKKAILKCILEFGIAIAIFVLGIMQTKSRLNLLTLVAILGCLPASKALVEVIVILPYKSIDKRRAEEIDSRINSSTKIYDTIFTSEKNFMPIESIVIRKHTICGYSSSEKMECQMVEEHLRKYLATNHITTVSIKIYKDYVAYLERINEMNLLEKGEYDELIQNILLNLSI